MLNRTRMASLAALAVAGTAAWTWSQETVPLPEAVDVLRTVTAEPVTDTIPARTIIRTDAVSGLVQAQPPIEVRGRVFEAGDVGSAPAAALIRANGNGDVFFTGPAVPPPPHAGFRAVPRTRAVVEWSYVPLREEEQAEQKELKGLIETLNSDKPAEKKAEAKKQLQALLEKQFSRDVERREKEVAELEERVKKLRDQLDKRKTAKEKIIGLRVDTIQNEADGLGFPDLGGGPREVNTLFSSPGFGVPGVSGIPAVPGAPATISVFGTTGAGGGTFNVPVAPPAPPVR